MLQTQSNFRRLMCADCLIQIENFSIFGLGVVTIRGSVATGIVLFFRLPLSRLLFLRFLYHSYEKELLKNLRKHLPNLNHLKKKCFYFSNFT